MLKCVQVFEDIQMPPNVFTAFTQLLVEETVHRSIQTYECPQMCSLYFWGVEIVYILYATGVYFVTNYFGHVGVAGQSRRKLDHNFLASFGYSTH